MARFNYLHFLLLLIVIIFFSVLAETQSSMAKVIPCVQFKNRLCIRCLDLTHLKDQQCYQNIENCTQYQYGSASAICRNYLTQQNSTLTTTSTVTVKNSTYYYSYTTTSQSSTSSLAIQSIFSQILITQAQKDNLFVRCNDYMRKGQYSHFISRSQNPIKSVFQSFNQDLKNFKILYEGSGGNLLMCLISINIKTNSILLRSFVTIGPTQIIQSCVDYTSGMQCNRCREGCHLDSTINGDEMCVQDIPGCVEYYGNICTKCRGHYFLIQNRCVSDCQALRDSRSLKFYGGYDMSRTQKLPIDISRDYFF